MKKLHRVVYSYSPTNGVADHAVVERRRAWIVISPRAESIFTLLLPKTELDAGLHYYTTAARAIEAFIVKAEIALSDAARAANHAGWREALGDARDRLCQLSSASTSQPKGTA